MPFLILAQIQPAWVDEIKIEAGDVEVSYYRVNMVKTFALKEYPLDSSLFATT